MFELVGVGSISPWFFGIVMLILSILLILMYERGAKGIKIYENAMKILVWGIAIIFAIVAFVTGIRWNELAAGFTQFYVPWDDPKGVRIVIGALGAAVGINMVFLYPYSLLKKKWGKRSRIRCQR